MEIDPVLKSHLSKIINAFKSKGGARTPGQPFHTFSAATRHKSLVERYSYRDSKNSRGPLKQVYSGGEWYYVDQDGNKVENPL